MNCILNKITDVKVFAVIMNQMAEEECETTDFVTGSFTNVFNAGMLYGLKTENGEWKNCFLLYDSQQNMLQYIWVSAEERRKGIGKYMIQKLCNMYGKDTLLLNNMMKSSKRFWKKMGTLEFRYSRWFSTVYELKLKV